MTPPSVFATTRRRLLGAGAVGTALLSAGGVLSWLTRGYDDGALPLAALSNKERAVVAAVVEALLPARGAYPSGFSVGVVERIDEEVFSQPDGVRADLQAAIQLLEHSPPLVGSFHRLTVVPVDERAAVFDALLQRGPAVVVQAGAALKQLTSLAYFADPRVWAAIGYDGPWIPEPRPPPSHARWVEAVARARTASPGGASRPPSSSSSSSSSTPPSSRPQRGA